MCYQIPALAKDGIVLVVCPLIGAICFCLFLVRYNVQVAVNAHHVLSVYLYARKNPDAFS